ncbi:MAG: succinate dehydrogenase/fumarate reductase iron-sulfur subunit, partial [Chloroflexi bacterium]
MAVASAKGAPANGSVALQVFRGDPAGGAEERFEVPMQEGMVVLDAIHYIQAHF